MRVVGGRTNVWGRQSYRLSEQDLKGKSFDGYGDDWPLSYQDLSPYYDIVEEYVGITGQAEGVPELPDSKFHPAMPMTCAEMQVRTRVKQKLGYTVTIGRAANITKPINGRAPCHYCGPCEQGCQTHSYFNSAFTTVADALKSGNTTLITNAMVYKVLMDPQTTKATGVMYIDRNTREVKEVRARVVIVAAQTLESARLLFNSATPQFSNGLANSSGALGHYLMDHIWVAGGATGHFPDVPSPPPSLGAPKPADRPLHDPHAEHDAGTTVEGVHPRLRVPGRRQPVVQLQRAGLRRRVQAVDQGSDQQRVVRRLRRVPGPLR